MSEKWNLLLNLDIYAQFIRIFTVYTTTKNMKKTYKKIIETKKKCIKI